MPVLFLIMYLLALVCFLVAAFGRPSVPHINLIALGLVFFTVPSLVLAVQGVGGG